MGTQQIQSYLRIFLLFLPILIIQLVHPNFLQLYRRRRTLPAAVKKISWWHSNDCVIYRASFSRTEIRFFFFFEFLNFPPSLFFPRVCHKNRNRLHKTISSTHSNDTKCLWFFVIFGHEVGMVMFILEKFWFAFEKSSRIRYEHFSSWMPLDLWTHLSKNF